VSLDPDESNIGYRMGRLFAVLENIQRSAQVDINVTIRDRYFSAAMTAPRSAFAELMRLKNAHLKKVRRSNAGLAVHFERLLDQILGALPPSAGFPAFLSLDDQGRFILGYHHQRNFRSGAVEMPSNLVDVHETAE
jgi:CRISPR-associated protein Csd1